MAKLVRYAKKLRVTFSRNELTVNRGCNDALTQKDAADLDFWIAFPMAAQGRLKPNEFDDLFVF